MKKVLLLILVLAIIITLEAKDQLFYGNQNELSAQAYEEMNTLDIMAIMEHHADASQLDKENIDRILYNLKNIDWAKYEKMSDPMNLLDWLNTLEKSDLYALKHILQIVDTNLDGAYYKKYAGIILDFFIEDEKGFVSVLASMDEELIDKVCILLEYELPYNSMNSSVKKNISQLIKDETLTEKEEDILKRLLEKID